MNNKKSKNKLNGIIGLYVKWGQHSLLFTLVCIAWLAWRVGTKPIRLNYPCSQFALAQIMFFFTPASLSLFSLVQKCISYVRKKEYLKVARMTLVVAILVGGALSYQNFHENQLRAEGSGTIPIAHAAIAGILAPEPQKVTRSGEFPSVISPAEAVVSLNYNPSITYGGSPPYDPESNPAYNFVWETVEKLDLGNASNPLDDLMNAGDTVLIKPNWVDYGTAVYTRPEVVRPLVDMAISAGATTIYIGDGGGCLANGNNVINNAGYSQMVSQLASRHPGITIQTVNLISLSYGWHWVNMGGNSSFAGSPYSHYDLAAGGNTLFQHTHYSTADPQGVNPNGDTLGWYAVNDKILSADVIINVPKMKTHQTMIATMSIKNFVGCSQGCTYNEQVGDCQPRMPHHKTSGQDYYFNNDIFWRAILDMNKIVLYGDQNGVLQSTQQRKYLTVIDGIQAMEKSQHQTWGGGGKPYDRHVILASIDPAAADAVGCRVMGYDYNAVPSISNADSDGFHPIGTNNPENIAVIGDELGSGLNHVFEFNPAWSGNAGDLAITDFIPPTINSADTEGNTVTASISGGLVAYLLYQTDGEECLQKMNKDGNTYYGTVADTVSEYQILAQDEYFNTVATTFATAANNPPAADDQDIETEEDNSIAITLTASDIDGDLLTYEIIGAPAHGTLSGTAPGVTYDPTPDYFGADSFIFKANDGMIDSNTATVTITVSGIPDPPDQPVLVAPEDRGEDINTPPVLEVTVSDPDNDPLNVTFYGREASPDENFTIVVLPDTQLYAQDYPDIFTSQTHWIVDNETAKNIVFVTHLGDIVNTANSGTQWINADAAMDLLDPSGIPYSVGPGNHDIGTGSLFETYFGVSRFAGKSWYGGHYGSDNFNNYSLFSSGGMDFILINLQYNPTTAILDWADALLKSNIDRRGIIESHNMLNIDNSWSNQNIYNSLKDNSNLFLMLCGHMHSSTDGAAQRTEMGDYGNTIYILMSDYQEYPSGGNGYLRIMRFSPEDDRIYVQTYSPYTAGYLTDAQNQFELTYDMVDSTSFEVIGTVNAVASGGTASINWPGLASETPHQWYVEVNDGSQMVTGPIWSFTTLGTNQPPTANAGTDQTVQDADGNSAEDITLNGTGSTDIDGTIISYVWSEGGSQMASEATPTVVFSVGVHTVTLTVTDDDGTTDVDTVSITVTAVNHPPVAGDDSATTNENIPIVINVLANDTDPDTGDILHVTSVTQGSHGAVANNGNNVTYTPITGYVGTDYFTYKSNDGQADSNSAIVSISVNQLGTITVNDFENYRVFQRDIGGTSKSVTVTGTYADMTWSRVEARVLGHGTDTVVVGWMPIDTTDGGGTFSGSLTVPQGGWYDIEVRAVDSGGSILGSSRGANKWGVGMSILCIGQSNMTGHGLPPYTVVNSDLAVNYSNAGIWEHLADPYDDDSPPGAVDRDTTAGGSMVPALANSLLQTFNFPIAFIPAAKDGSNLYSQWAYRNPSNHFDTTTLYGQSITKAINAGGVELIIMHQGEADTNANRTEAQYEANFATLIGNYRQDLYAGIPIFICQLGTIDLVSGDARTDADVQAVRNAQHDLDNSVNIFMAATAMDQPRLDEVHYTRPGLEVIGQRMAQAIKYYFNAASYYRGPAIISAAFTDNLDTIDVQISHRGGNDFSPASGITGFSVLANSSPVAISSAARIDADHIRLTLASVVPQGAAATVRYLWGADPNNTNIVKDNSSMALPLENTTTDIVVFSTNTAPVAVGDTYTVNEDSVLTVTAPGVLGNDSDNDGDSLTAIKVTNPSHGTVNINSNGSFTYTPSANYNGTDSFTYKANDGQADSNIVTVTINVAPVNDTPSVSNDSYSTNMNTTLNITAPGVMGNDSDVDGNTLTAIKVTDPGHGTLTLNGNGSFSYVPAANYSGADSFTYKANDGQADSNVATVNLTVAPATATFGLNAGNNSYNQESNELNTMRFLNTAGAGSITKLEILFNDTTPNGNVRLGVYADNNGTPGTLLLDAGQVSVANGWVSISNLNLPVTSNTYYWLVFNLQSQNYVSYQSGQPSGSKRWRSYTFGTLPSTFPASSSSSTNQFVMRATVLQENPNTPPISVVETFSTTEDNVLSVGAPGVLSNDSDPDLDTLIAIMDDNPTHGTLILNADGSFTYTPATNFNGIDSFTYKANDGKADSNVATVTINVAPVNDTPSVSNDSYSANMNTTLNITAPGVLGNDSDVDGNTLTAIKVNDPDHGILTLNSDGSFSYIPESDYIGNDFFTYKVNDGQLDSGTATVNFDVTRVNTPPVAQGETYGAEEDNILNMAAPGVLGNDSDSDLDMLTALKVSNPAHGTLTLNANGSFTYTPYANYNGSDAFTYKANDGQADSNIVTVTINIAPVNDTPSVSNDSYSTNMNTTLNITAPGVLGNDSDVDGNILTAIKVTDPGHGTLTLNGNGSFSYVPAANYSGADSFTYKANDGQADSNVATVNLTVAPATATFGLNAGNNSYNQETNELNTMRFLNTAGAGSITKLEILFNDTTPNGNVRLGVYADNNGTPGTLLLDAGQVSVANGWVSISNLNLPVTSNTYYWLVFNLQSQNYVTYQSGQPSGSKRWRSYTFGTLPSTFPASSSSSTNQFVMRATVTR